MFSMFLPKSKLTAPKPPVPIEATEAFLTELMDAIPTVGEVKLPIEGCHKSKSKAENMRIIAIVIKDFAESINTKSETQLSKHRESLQTIFDAFSTNSPTPLQLEIRKRPEIQDDFFAFLVLDLIKIQDTYKDISDAGKRKEFIFDAAIEIHCFAKDSLNKYGNWIDTWTDAQETFRVKQFIEGNRETVEQTIELGKKIGIVLGLALSVAMGAYAVSYVANKM